MVRYVTSGMCLHGVLPHLVVQFWLHKHLLPGAEFREVVGAGKCRGKGFPATWYGHCDKETPGSHAEAA
jgi:hypothetical protein